MAKKSDYGNEILVTNSSGVTFDLNKDYSKAINEAKAAGQDTSQLEAQRQAKIDSSAYGGALRIFRIFLWTYTVCDCRLRCFALRCFCGTAQMARGLFVGIGRQTYDSNVYFHR